MSDVDVGLNPKYLLLGQPACLHPVSLQQAETIHTCRAQVCQIADP